MISEIFPSLYFPPQSFIFPVLGILNLLELKVELLEEEPIGVLRFCKILSTYYFSSNWGYREEGCYEFFR